MTAAGTPRRQAQRYGRLHSRRWRPGYDCGRYTAPTAKDVDGSPSWVAVLMLGFFVVGALFIMARYLWWDSDIPMIAGMAYLLGGLFARDQVALTAR